MHDWLTMAVLVLAATALVAGGVLLFRDLAAQDRTFALLGLLEVALVLQVVLGLVALAGASSGVDGVLFVSYLIGIVVALPVGVFWSLAERTRAGTGVLLVAVLTVVALQIRLDAIWGGAGA